MNTQTQHVVATGFLAGEVEIFDFVTERVKRCIAANLETLPYEISPFISFSCNAQLFLV